MSLLSEDREPFRLSSIKALTPDDTDLFAFGGSVGPNGENRREDVIRAQTLLARTGDFNGFDIPTGWPSSDLYRGIKAFQKRHGKQADGMLLPVPPGGVDQYGVGETVHALRNELGVSLAGHNAPTTKEIDGYYEAQARRQTAEDETPSPAVQNGIVLSDVPDAAPLRPKPGQKVAQALPVNPAQFAPPPSGGTPDQHRDENGVSSAERQVGRMLEQRVNEKINLLTLPVQVMNHVRENGAAFKPAPEDKPTPPSKPMSDADRASTRSPPLTPPKVDTRLQGRPAEEREPVIEQLIPAEMKEWYEGLEPFDQALAKDLLLVFNRRGDETTRLGNARLTQALMTEFTNRPGLAGKIEHVGGSIKNGVGKYLPEEHIPHPETGQTGGHWPDMTFRLAKELADELGFEYLRINTGRMLKRIPGEGVMSERLQRDGIRALRPNDMIEIAEKLRPDQRDGTASRDVLVKYDETTAGFALRIANALEAKRKLKK